MKNALYCIYATITLSATSIFLNWTYKANITFQEPEGIEQAVAFAIAVLAILIPLSSSTIAKISDRYKSTAITSHFRKEPINKHIIYSTVVLIICGVATLLLFRIKPPISKNLLNSLIYTNVALLLILLSIVIMHLITINNYISGSDYLVTTLTNEINTCWKHFQKYSTETNAMQLISALKGLVDILEYDIQQDNNNKINKKSLDAITNLSKQYLDLKIRDQEMFYRTTLPNDLFQEWKYDPDSTLYKLHLFPQNYTLSLQDLITPLFRALHLSIQHSNPNSESLAAKNIIDTLITLTTGTDNIHNIEYMLNEILRSNEFAVSNKSAHRILLLSTWYTQISTDDHINTDYIPIINSLFFKNLTLLSKYNDFEKFKEILSELLTRTILILNTDTNPIHKYITQMYSLQLSPNQLAALEYIKSNDKVYSQQDLQKWKNNLKIVTEFSHDSINTTNINNECTNYAESFYKLTWLFDSIFSFGAYCLFTKQYNYINELWHCKQPSDTEITFCGPDIKPPNREDLINEYFHKYSRSPEYSMEGRHSLNYYKELYFYLLLCLYTQNAANHIPIAENILIDKLIIAECQLNITPNNYDAMKEIIPYFDIDLNTLVKVRSYCSLVWNDYNSKRHPAS